MEWFEQVAQKYHMSIDNDAADSVLKGLEFNKIEHGTRYCPCRIKRIKDNICPCKEMRKTRVCHCGLFKMEDIDDTKN